MPLDLVDLVALWPLFDEEDEDYDEYDSSAAFSGNTPAAVTFPTTPLNFRVQIGLSLDYSRPWWEWNWTDITQYVRWTPTIAWSTGRPDEASSVDTGTGALTLDNTDGRFSRRNPYGPYYGQLTKNTPIWVQADPGSGFVTLLQHYVNEWPSRWDQSRNDVTVPIATAGILRRLQQGSAAKSPLRRAILSSSPEAYWPLEDGDEAEAAGAAVEGPPLRISGTVDFAAFTDLAGAVQTPDMTAGTLYGSVSGVSATAWHAEFAIKMPFNGVSVVARVYTRSTEAAIWRIFLPTGAGGACQVYVTDISGVTVLFSLTGATVVATFENTWHHIAITAEQSGSTIIGALYVDGVLEATNAGFPSAGTLGEPYEFWANHQVTTVTSMAHIAVGSGAVASRASDALDGYVGEQAHVRVARICAEEAIPFTAGPGPSMAMGPQPIGTSLEIFRDCELADLGSLYEIAFGLGYQSHTERDNASVKLTLDMDQGHVSQPPEPTDDDQSLTNRFTASRSGGSEATFEKTTGPLGTGIGGPGIYDDSATPNVQTDTQLLAYASARVNRGTVDEDRWPSVQSNFAATPSLIATWTGMEPFGARINITHPPTQMAPDTIDAFIDGYSVAVTPIDWDVAINTTPGSPHRVFVLAGPSDDTNPNLGYMVPTTCVLAEDLDTTETGVDITTTPLWSTTAEDWTPGALITVDGEDMTVTAVSGGSNPQTLTVTRSVNGVIKTHTSGATVAFKFPGNLGL